jgi:tRNA(Ile)-lysidine synthase
VRYLVAVSGGIDSVVLLDRLAKRTEHDIIVAHFDHGIRGDSAADARFVAGLAAAYHFPFVSRREELGRQASEETARRQRYAFLREMAQLHQAVIVTAHHADDVIETIAINLERGTGWRGVAILDTPGIVRPLLGLMKTDIRAYALHHRLEWVEDSTNESGQYLRNRIRHRIATRLNIEQKKAVLALWHQQVVLKASVGAELDSLLEDVAVYSRYFFTHSDELTAAELLRAVIIRTRVTGLTRPQLERGLLAVKTARAGTIYEVGNGVRLCFTKRDFIVETGKKMLLLEE